MKESQPIEQAAGAADERAVARKYGVRELIFPDSDQIRALCQYLTATIETGRSGGVPKTAVLVMLEFLQGTVNRQFITKSPTMSKEDFDLLQTPYYVAARIISKIDREKRDAAAQKGQLYQNAYLTITQLIDLLRGMIDPSSPWLRQRQVPWPILEAMEVLCAFAQLYPEARRRGRAV
jgi:hypothetical protein